MDYSRNAPKTYVLKVYIHCPGCEKKVHKTLMKIDGVRSVEIDGENAKVKVSGEGIEQYTLLKALSKIGKKAEILSVSSNGMNQHMTSKKEQLSEPGKLKQVEVTHSKTLKTTTGNGYTEKSCEYSIKHVVTRESREPTKHHNLGNGYYDHVDDDDLGHDRNCSMKVTADDCWNREPNGVCKVGYVTNNCNRDLEHHHHGHDHNHNHNHNHGMTVTADDGWNRKPVQYGGRKSEIVANDHWNREPEHHHHGHAHDHNHSAMSFTSGHNHCASRAAPPPPLPQLVKDSCTLM